MPGTASLTIAQAIPPAQLRTAMGDFVLIASLVAMATVGALGLTSAMSVSVLERTREFGVMRAIGAGPRQVRPGAVSWAAAGALR